jgi:hypothetical protein
LIEIPINDRDRAIGIGIVIGKYRDDDNPAIRTSSRLALFKTKKKAIPLMESIVSITKSDPCLNSVYRVVSKVEKS